MPVFDREILFIPTSTPNSIFSRLGSSYATNDMGELLMSDLQLTQIDHVSVIITNVQRSRSFYRDLLGLKEIPKPKTFDFVALWFDLGNGQTLHLLLKDQPDCISPRHFCLRVTDAQKARAYFRERGISMQETTLIHGADRFFVFDPDGNRIELMHWLEPYDPARSGAAQLDGWA